VKRLILGAAVAAALIAMPASAQPASSPYETLTVTESFPDGYSATYTASCDWYEAASARDLLEHGSYRVILPGNHGWVFCN
jgi:hypothetical protein